MFPDGCGFQITEENASKLPAAQRLVGHRQVTDAYLLGLALRRGGKLATLDRSVLALLADESPERQHVEVI